LVRVVDAGQSGKSQLTYEVGCTGDKELQLRVVGNSNAGCWNSGWVSLKAIQAAFDKVPAGEPVTSDTLRSMFTGKSTNSSGFYFAVLKHVGYVVPSTTKARCYDRTEPTAFREEMAALIEGRTPPKTDAKPKKDAGKKAALVKRPSGPTKRAK
jgi:hypothetical protein